MPLIVIFLLALVFSTRAGAIDLVTPRLSAAELQAAHILADKLYHEVNPALPGNAYFPSFLVEKINWVYATRVTKRLDIAVVEDATNTLGAATAMASRQKDGMLQLLIAARAFVTKPLGSLQPSELRMLRNSFAVALAHEAVHLERGVLHFATEHPRDELLREEMRAWLIIDTDVVAPLLALGEPLSSVFTSYHDMRLTCRDPNQCPALRALVASRVPRQ